MIEFVSLDTIINDLINIIRGAKVAASETISYRHIEKWVHEYRARLIKQDLDKGKYANPAYIQELLSIRLVTEDRAGDNSTLSTGTNIFRTENQIPKTIDFNFKSGLVSVESVNGKEIQLVPQGRAKWQKYKRFTKNDAICYLKNQYLYFESIYPIEYVNLRGIFEVPPLAALYTSSASTSDGYTLDSPYPIPINMVPILKEMILKQELGITSQAFSDSITDSQPVVTPNIEKEG